MKTANSTKVIINDKGTELLGVTGVHAFVDLVRLAKKRTESVLDRMHGTIYLGATVIGSVLKEKKVYSKDYDKYEHEGTKMSSLFNEVFYYDSLPNIFTLTIEDDLGASVYIVRSAQDKRELYQAVTLHDKYPDDMTITTQWQASYIGKNKVHYRHVWREFETKTVILNEYFECIHEITSRTYDIAKASLSTWLKEQKSKVKVNDVWCKDVYIVSNAQKHGKAEFFNPMGRVIVTHWKHANNLGYVVQVSQLLDDGRDCENTHFYESTKDKAWDSVREWLNRYIYDYGFSL